MSNTVFALWIGLSAALLLLFVYAAFINLRNRQARPVGLDELIPAFLPVDVDAFTLLVQLQESVESGASASEKLKIRGEQTAVIVDYLRRMSHNAALLQRLGYSQLMSGNPLISDLAQQMIDAGVHVRLYTFVGLIALRLSTVLPIISLDIVPARRMTQLRQMMSASLIPAYEQLKDRAGNLTCLKFSGLHEALIHSL